MIANGVGTVQDRLTAIRELSFRLSINCLKCVKDKAKNSDDIPTECSKLLVRDPHYDVLITPSSGNDFTYLTQSYKDWVCRLMCALYSQAAANPFGSNGRKLQAFNDPTVVIVSSTLTYNPIYFYQSIVYRKNGVYYYQQINTGMTLGARLLARWMQQERINLPVSAFPSREQYFKNVLPLLLIKPVVQGFVSRDFAKVAAFINVTGTFEQNSTQLTPENVGDVFGVCGQSTCNPFN